MTDIQKQHYQGLMEVLNIVVRIYIGFGRNDGLVSEKKGF